MICVTLAHGSHSRVLIEHAKLAEEKVSLVELRLDILRKDPELHRLLPRRPTPVVVTIRRPVDGGFWKEPEEKRLRLLRAAIVEGVEYVDLEKDIAASIPRYGKTKRIISYHNMEETPADLLALHREMMTLDPDVVKIAVMPKNIKDVFRMTEFLKQVNKQGTKVPTIGISMGPIGTITRILAGKWGAPFTYASSSKDRNVAPGMIDYKSLRDLYRFDSINAETEVYAVIADPVGHSLSPLIHNTSFQAYKLNKVYIPQLLRPEDLSFFMQNATRWGIKGLSVTIPHKVAIINELTQLEAAVEEVGACNTVLFEDGKIYGDNTDCIAAVSAIAAVMKKRSDRENPIAGKRVLVLGAGGAGKAVAFGLISQKAQVVLADGDDRLAQEVAAKLGCEWCPWEKREGEIVQVLANCTPVGMFPKVDETPFDKRAIHTSMYVFDAIYNPMTTWLLRMARDKGCETISGVEMFVGQASIQFKEFTGLDPDYNLMRRVVVNALSAVKGC